MSNQESEGILSPIVKAVRLKIVASLIPRASTVLDIACGSGGLREYLPRDCVYWGVDRIEPKNKNIFDKFFCCDIIAERKFDTVLDSCLKNTDIVVMTAFLEHITDQIAFLSKFTSFTNNGGVIVGTTPHPIGRDIHKNMARIGLLSHGADEEHEDFLGKNELREIGEKSGMSLVRYKRFLLKMNQVFVFKSST